MSSTENTNDNAGKDNNSKSKPILRASANEFVPTSMNTSSSVSVGSIQNSVGSGTADSALNSANPSMVRFSPFKRNMLYF
jgi:hypothetical protein